MRMFIGFFLYSIFFCFLDMYLYPQYALLIAIGWLAMFAVCQVGQACDSNGIYYDDFNR